MLLKERVGKLGKAMALINEVKNSLECEKKVCECCGIIAYSDKEQYHVRENLKSVMTKLENIRVRMRTHPDKFNDWD